MQQLYMSYWNRKIISISSPRTHKFCISKREFFRTVSAGWKSLVFFFCRDRKKGNYLGGGFRFSSLLPTWGNDPIGRAYVSDRLVQPPTCYKWRPEQIDQKENTSFFWEGYVRDCATAKAYVVGILSETAYSGTLSTNLFDGMGCTTYICFKVFSIEVGIWKMSLLFGAGILAGIVVLVPVSEEWDHVTGLRQSAFKPIYRFTDVVLVLITRLREGI